MSSIKPLSPIRSVLGMAMHRKACAAVAALAAFAVGTLSACEQDPVFCLIASPFLASTYTVKDNDGSCEPVVNDGLGSAYHLGEGGDANRGDPYHGGMSLVPTSVRDFQNSLVGWGAELEVLSDYDSSFGPFKTSNPVKGQCEPETLSDYEFHHSAVDESADDPATGDVDESHGAFPEETVEVSWKDVKVTVTPEILGTYVKGEMTVKQACGTIIYEVRSFGPLIGCEDDEDCKVVSDIDKDWKAKCRPDINIAWTPGEMYGTCFLE